MGFFSVYFNYEAFEIPWVIFNNKYEKAINSKFSEPNDQLKIVIVPKQLAKNNVERSKSMAIEKKEMPKEKVPTEVKKEIPNSTSPL